MLHSMRQSPASRTCSRMRLLGLHRVGDHVGQGTVVADGAGQHVGDVAPDDLVEEAGGQHALLHRLADAAAAADAVDGAQMMLVAAFDRLALGQVDAQRSVEEGRLDVVDRDGVAAEDHVDPAARDQLGEGRGRTGVHHGRSEDGDDLLALARASPA